MARSLMLAIAIATAGVVLVADNAEAGRRHRRGCGGCGGGYSDCGGGGCGGYSTGCGGCGGYTTGCGGGCAGGCEGAVPYYNGPTPDHNTAPPAPTGDSPSNMPPPPQASAPSHAEGTIVTTVPTTTYRTASARRGLFGRR
jgi:hypothetical protein